MQAGEFRLNKTMDVNAIAEALTLGMQDAWVTIPEGLRVEEIATKLAKEFEIPEAEFLSLAREGYMFPDTYQIPRTASAAAIIAIFTDTFNEKVTPDVYVAAKKQGLTEKELIILASLVEREGKSKEDREMIAGILLNRIHEEWPLQVDATVQYMLGYQPQEKTWWKKNLTKLDLQIDSNFNTYKYPGLPPRPIANPGLEAILAVAYPVDSEYMFYIHDATGKAHYAKTVEEHNTNISQYLQ